MLLEIILVILLGIIAGTITGLIPGIHINLISITLISLISSTLILTNIPIIVIIIFIISMAITHTFIDFIPSIYLGAPDEDTILSTMPGHDFLLKGRAHEAVLLTLIGSVISIILLIIIIPFFFFLIPKTYPFIQKMMSWILIWTSVFLISKEKNSKLLALIIFILAGFLGIASLNLPINQPLLPLLTGLFGSSTLIYSISQKTKIPKQKTGKPILLKKQLIRPAITTTLISPICSFLPGLGSSQAAIIGSSIIKQSKKQFFILLGSINTLVMITSFATIYLIDKARTGTAAAIQTLTNFSQLLNQQPINLAYIILSIILTATISIFITIKISKITAQNILKLNYSKISIIILFFLTTITIYFTNILGLLVFITSTLLGLTSIYLGVRRGHLMGVLLIPTIIFYLPFF